MDLLMFPPMLDIGTTFTTIFKNMGWLVFATAALMISVVTGSLAYMASEALNLAKLKTWAKSELYEAVMNAAIIATTASVLVLLSALAGALTGYPDLYVPGELFLNTMDSTVTSVYVSLLAKEAWIGFLSTAGTSIYIGQPGITTVTLSVVPMSGMTVISDALITIIDAVGISLAAIIVQQVILSFFKETMLTFFLPA
ncbi:hypothetical protein FJZ26_00965, partial [Candidatus Parvarchaeota archaeon]|nr:hypothetical protein [Candidatus Parvarchaeota archaeon]